MEAEKAITGGDVGGEGRERDESLCFNAERNGTGIDSEWVMGAR